MNLTQIYATVIGGVFSGLIFFNIFRKLWLVLQRQKIFVLQHLIYPIVLNRHCFIGPWTRVNLFIRAIHFDISLFFTVFKAKSIFAPLPIRYRLTNPQGSNPLQQVPLNDSFASTDLESEQPDSQDLALSDSGSQNSQYRYMRQRFQVSFEVSFAEPPFQCSFPLSLLLLRSWKTSEATYGLILQPLHGLV